MRRRDRHHRQARLAHQGKIRQRRLGLDRARVTGCGSGPTARMSTHTQSPRLGGRVGIGLAAPPRPRRRSPCRRWSGRRTPGRRAHGLQVVLGHVVAHAGPGLGSRAPPAAAQLKASGSDLTSQYLARRPRRCHQSIFSPSLNTGRNGRIDAALEQPGLGVGVGWRRTPRPRRDPRRRCIEQRAAAAARRYRATRRQ